MQIANRVNKIASSQSLEMAARAKAMKAAGIDVISMSLGEPDMDTPNPSVVRRKKPSITAGRIMDRWQVFPNCEQLSLPARISL